VAFQPDPLCEKKITGVKISADPIMESIHSNHQQGRGRHCESLTFSQHFDIGLLKALPDITFELPCIQSKLFDLDI
jgi:hypothetical protein